jgi:predicted ATPase
MNHKPDHLTDEAWEVLASRSEDRVYFIQSKRWIAYPKSRQILEHLEKLLLHPRTTRMPSVAIYGDSGMGKSMLVEKFKSDHVPSFDAPSGRT